MVKIGDNAPPFALPNQDGDIVTLDDFAGRPLVIFSFPQAGTPDCTQQACNYRDEYESFQKLNAGVLGLSASTVQSLSRWHAAHQFPFNLLSDENHRVLEAYGAWGQTIIGVLELPFAKRSYWVIDSNGILQAQDYDVDPVASIQDSLAVVEYLSTH